MADLKERIAQEITNSYAQPYSGAERINQAYCEEIKKHQLTNEELEAVECPDPIQQLDSVDTALMSEMDILKARLRALRKATVNKQIQSILKALGGE